mgnify:CR=1 FL=1
MRRVVVTGLGIVSSIGNNADEVLTSLREGRSGITANEDMKEHGFRSQIAGAIDLDIKDHVDKRTLRFMGPGSAYAHIAMSQAISDAGLTEKEIINSLLEYLLNKMRYSETKFVLLEGGKGRGKRFALTKE